MGNLISNNNELIVNCNYKLPFRTHAIPYFAQSNILPITMLYFKLSSTLMLDITTNSAPQNICNLFTSTQDIHQYNTRSASSGNYYITVRTLEP